MLQLGQPASLSGDVTRLDAIAGRSPGHLEKMLGYGGGRLKAGYWIALLKEPLRSSDILFSGLTLRSGGREGLPLRDPVLDAARVHNHARMIDVHGQARVDAWLQELADNPLNLRGNKRIAKVVPVTRHSGVNPAEEYPMGGGAPQFTLKGSHAFLIAVEVDSAGVAKTAQGWSVSIADDASYDNRAKLSRYLISA